MDRIQTSDIHNYLQGKMLDNAIDHRDNQTRIFYWGIVIDNKDTSNSNRIKVRIPNLDDTYYVGRKKDEGDALLPWCVPMNRNFLSQPENNSLVLVAIMDPKTPYWGRIYFDALPSISSTSILDHTRLIPETDTYNNWDNLEALHNIVLGSKPQNANDYNAKENVIYDMGIKGKGNNRISLHKEKVSIYQNEGKDKQSMMEFSDSIKLESSDKISITSKKSNQTFHPLFDKPVYDYINEMNNVIKSIVTTLATSPGICPVSMAPNLPSTSGIQLIPKMVQLVAKFNKLKVAGSGASKYITIN